MCYLYCHKYFWGARNTRKIIHFSPLYFFDKTNLKSNDCFVTVASYIPSAPYVLYVFFIRAKLRGCCKANVQLQEVIYSLIICLYLKIYQFRMKEERSITSHFRMQAAATDRGHVQNLNVTCANRSPEVYLARASPTNRS